MKNTSMLFEEFSNSLAEAKQKNFQWKKKSHDEKVELLLSVVEDPDQAEEYAEMCFNDLPDNITSNLKESFTINEAKVKPFIDFAIDKNAARKQLKKGKYYWIKKDTWEDWKEFKFLKFEEYDWDFALKILLNGHNKGFTLLSKEFGSYQLSNVDPTEHAAKFDDKGNVIKVSKKGIWTMKSLKKEMKSYELKKYTDSEAMDMLADFLDMHPGTIEWINKKNNSTYDKYDAADWLYNMFS